MKWEEVGPVFIAEDEVDIDHLIFLASEAGCDLDAWSMHKGCEWPMGCRLLGTVESIDKARALIFEGICLPARMKPLW